MKKNQMNIAQSKPQKAKSSGKQALRMVGIIVCALFVFVGFGVYQTDHDTTNLLPVMLFAAWGVYLLISYIVHLKKPEQPKAKFTFGQFLRGFGIFICGSEAIVGLSLIITGLLDSSYSEMIFGGAFITALFSLFLILLIRSYHKHSRLPKVDAAPSAPAPMDVSYQPTARTDISYQQPAPEVKTVPHPTEPVKPQMLYFDLHPDIAGLVWFENGPNKNTDHFPQLDQDYTYINDDISLQFNYTQSEEPSAIDLNLEVSSVGIEEKVGYYPSYKDLTPHQRYRYLQYLQNPYDPNADIGYAFLLLYGLERHLLSDNFERAFDVVLKLRSIYQNNSFQWYSYNALLIACLKQGRADYAKRLLLTPTDNISLVLLLKIYFEIPMSAKELMSCYHELHFTPVTYIKDRPEQFEAELMQVLCDRYGTPEFPVYQHCHPNHEKKLDIVNSNYSMQIHMQAADPLSDAYFCSLCIALLTEAHQRLKMKLAQERKNH